MSWSRAAHVLAGVGTCALAAGVSLACHSTETVSVEHPAYGRMYSGTVPLHLAGDTVTVSVWVATPGSSSDGTTLVGAPVDFTVADGSVARIISATHVITAPANIFASATAEVLVVLLKEGSTTVNASVAGATYRDVDGTTKPVAEAVTVTAQRPASIAVSPASPLVIELRTTKFQLKPTLLSTTNAALADVGLLWTCPQGETVVAMTAGSACNTTTSAVTIQPVSVGTTTFHVALPPALFSRFPLAADVQITVTNNIGRIDLAAGSVSVGSSTTITPTFRDAAGTVLAGYAASRLRWKSADTSVATVDQSGLVTGKAADTVTVFAFYDDREHFDSPPFATGSIKLAVGPTSNIVTITPSTFSMVVGATRTLTAKVTDASGTEIFPTVTFLSRDVSIAQFLDPRFNTLTALSTGPNTQTPSATVQILARAGGAQGVATVTVYRPVVSIVVNPNTLTLRTGQTAQLLATLFDGSGNLIPNSATTLTWTALDATNATVSSTGIVTAATPSSTPARIRVSEPGGASTIVNVTVLPPPTTLSLSIATGTSSRPANPSEALGVGSATSLVGTLKDANGVTISDALTFTTSSSAIATVTSTGVNAATITGVSAGTATIRVSRTSDPSSSATVLFVVSNPTTGGTVDRLALGQTSGTTTVGGTFNYTVTALDASGNPASNCTSVNWNTDASAIASIVSNNTAPGVLTGVATGLSAGTTAVRAFCTDHTLFSAAARLIVAGATGVTQVNITPRFVYLASAGTSQVYTASLLPAGNATPIEWVLLQSPAGVLTATPSGPNNTNVTIALPTGAGASSGGARIIARAGGQSDTSWVTYGNAGSIKGTVVSTSNQYLGGLVATATLAGGGTVVSGGVNNEGIFYLAGLPVGTYSVSVRQAGNPIAQTISNVVVTAGGTALLTLAPFP